MPVNGARRRPRLGIAGSIVWVAAACGAVAGESQHLRGPEGLSGWKATYLLDNGDEVADTLVIARNGKVIRRLHGDPLVWRWMFQDEGKSIAYESGPLHFAMACVSIDIASGKELERLDCFRYPDQAPAGGWPAWVVKLEGPD